jgi:hypothetical protein
LVLDAQFFGIAGLLRILKVIPMIEPKEFYKTAEIQTPYDLPHRLVKLKVGENWIKLFGCREDQLRKKLVRYAPGKAYISVSCYLTPEFIGKKWLFSKRGYKYLHNIVLSSDFVMDFDNGVNSLVQMLKTYKYLKSLGFEEFKAICTKRGFHLWVLDWYVKICRENLPYSPKHREFYIMEKKKELCDKLESQNIEFDRKVSEDTRRIVKLWGSLSDESFICKAYDNPKLLAKEYIANRSYLLQMNKYQAKPLISHGE